MGHNQLLVFADDVNLLDNSTHNTRKKTLLANKDVSPEFEYWKKSVDVHVSWKKNARKNHNVKITNKSKRKKVYRISNVWVILKNKKYMPK